MEEILKIVIVICATGGLSLAYYIGHKKSRNETMVCPLDSDCEAVVHSDYSKFMGVSVEYIGITYYSFIALSYLFVLLIPAFITPFTSFLLFSITSIAFLFSLYLTFIQAFAIKQWCAWCLTSAFLCLIIFMLSLSALKFDFISLLGDHRQIIMTLHLLGVAIGLGGATITDIFFFKFLKDFRISEWEAYIMRTLSQIIWFALAIIIITGFGLYAPEIAKYNDSSKFLIKMVVVSVIIVNGAFLNLFVTPKLVTLSFQGEHNHKEGETRRNTKIAFASGGISISSWYLAFVLGTLSKIGLSFLTLLVIYIGALILVVIGSQIMERVFTKKASTQISL